MEITPLIYHETSIDKGQFSNVLLIHDEVADYETFVSSANTTTFPIVYSVNSSKADLLALIQEHFTTIQRIAFVSTHL